MIDTLLQTIAPHHCYGCGEAGSALCGNCKYNIVSEPFAGCIVCQRAVGPRGVCSTCTAGYDRAWVAAQREGEMEQLLNAYKFQHQKASWRVLTELLAERLPDFAQQPVVVVPVPTIARHIRQRGYDHVGLVARSLATQRQLPYRPVLRRQTNSVQLGATRRQRLAQAKEAFRVKGELCTDDIYLLVDDVVTTGATLEYAARALKKAGAKQVWVAALVRQPLDKAADF